MITLTPASMNLLRDLAEDAPNWSGEPPAWVSKEERGNLTQLKKAGMLVTFISEGDPFAVFTRAGVALVAQEFDIDLSWVPTAD
jgi:hypothetical protein